MILSGFQISAHFSNKLINAKSGRLATNFNHYYDEISCIDEEYSDSQESL
jgi:hypothetical protein